MGHNYCLLIKEVKVFCFKKLMSSNYTVITLIITLFIHVNVNLKLNRKVLQKAIQFNGYINRDAVFLSHNKKTKK